MLKRILTYLQKNITTSKRNNMVIYMILFPVILAIGMNFFMPAVTEVAVTVAVDKNVGSDFINKMENYANVELYDSADSVKERVKRVDDVSGIIKEGNEYVVLLEGNEPESAVEMSRAVMNQIISPAENVSYQHATLDKGTNMMKEMGGSLLLLNAILISGLVIGFSIIEEKETEAIRSLSVSPLNLTEFIISHTIFTVVLGLILAILPTLILAGTSVNYWMVVIATVCTIGIGLAWGFLIGGLSDNLLSAIAVIKGTMLFLIGIPIGSVFMPDSYRWIFYIFPNYWAFQVYRNIFNGNQQWISFNNASLISLAFSFIIIIVMIPMLNKRLNLR